MRIEDLGLSVRAVNVLSRQNIKTAEQLIQAAEHPEIMLTWPNLGVKTLNELQAKAEELKPGEAKQENGDGCNLPPQTHIVNLSLIQA